VYPVLALQQCLEVGLVKSKGFANGGRVDCGNEFTNEIHISDFVSHGHGRRRSHVICKRGGFTGSIHSQGIKT
jgi:hypothetical protein